MGPPFIVKWKIRRKGWGEVQLHKYQNRNFECWHPLSSSFKLIFLASSDWPSVTEWWWPSLWLADRPVNVVNQPVTCYEETGGAAEKCWYTKSYHLKAHQLCRMRISPDAAISWKRRNPAGKKRQDLKINAALKWLCWQHQSRLESEHLPRRLPALKINRKIHYKNEIWKTTLAFLHYQAVGWSPHRQIPVQIQES